MKIYYTYNVHTINVLLKKIYSVTHFHFSIHWQGWIVNIVVSCFNLKHSMRKSTRIKTPSWLCLLINFSNNSYIEWFKYIKVYTGLTQKCCCICHIIAPCSAQLYTKYKVNKILSWIIHKFKTSRTNINELSIRVFLYRVAMTSDKALKAIEL